MNSTHPLLYFYSASKTLHFDKHGNTHVGHTKILILGSAPHDILAIYFDLSERVIFQNFFCKYIIINYIRE